MKKTDQGTIPRFLGGIVRKREFLNGKSALGWAMVSVVIVFSASGAFSASETIIDEWSTVKAPPPPEIKQVTVDPKTTALLILDIQNGNCNPKRRPRCVASVPKIHDLLTKARAKEMPVIYSLTSRATVKDIREEVTPLGGEPIVKSSVDKFFGTDLEKILKDRGIKTVILVGTAANGAVLGTAIGAAMRRLQVIVPVDGMSDTPYSEQYVAWHLANGPGTRGRTTLTRISWIGF